MMKSKRRKLRVLFVDDDEAVRATWKYAFGDDFEATFVATGEAALALLKAPPGGLQFDVLVADHRMPGMSGAELCWKAREVAPETARIIVTAYKDREVQLCPCSTVLEKPDRAGSLGGVIRKAAQSQASDEDVRRRECEAEAALKEARAEFRETTERLRSWHPLKERA